MDIEKVLRQWREVITAVKAKAGIVILGFDSVNNRTEFINVNATGEVQTEVTNTVDVEVVNAAAIPVDASGAIVTMGTALQVVPIVETDVPNSGNVDIDFDLRDLVIAGFFTLDLEVSELDSPTSLNDIDVELEPLNVSLKDDITVTFDIDLVVDDGTVVTINSVALGNVVWNTDNDTTMDDIAAQILTHANVEAAVASGALGNHHLITVTAKPELDVVIDSAVVTNAAPGSEAVATIVRTADVEVWVVPANSAAIVIETALDISTIGATAHWILNTDVEANDAGDNSLLSDGLRVNIANGAGGAGKIIGKLNLR